MTVKRPRSPDLSLDVRADLPLTACVRAALWTATDGWAAGVAVGGVEVVVAVGVGWTLPV